MEDVAYQVEQAEILAGEGALALVVAFVLVGIRRFGIVVGLAANVVADHRALQPQLGTRAFQLRHRRPDVLHGQVGQPGLGQDA